MKIVQAEFSAREDRNLEGLPAAAGERPHADHEDTERKYAVDILVRPGIAIKPGVILLKSRPLLQARWRHDQGSCRSFGGAEEEILPDPHTFYQGAGFP